MIFFIKVTLVWFVIAVLAIVNGIAREAIFAPYLGTTVALPLSGITLSLIILIVTFFTFNFFKVTRRLHCFAIGLQWLAMTLIFELTFGYYVAKKTWQEILEVFQLFEGNLFLLALLTSLLAPSLVAAMKSIKLAP